MSGTGSSSTASGVRDQLASPRRARQSELVSAGFGFARGATDGPLRRVCVPLLILQLHIPFNTTRHGELCGHNTHTHKCN